jgi:hypothetical protein
VSQSLQVKDRDYQSSCSPSESSFLHTTGGERDVQVLDLKGLVDKYLGTHDLMYSTYHEG